MRPRYWQHRIYVALSAALTMWVVWSEPLSLGHRIITRSGAAGWYAVAALGAVCAVAVVDAVVNDVFHLGRRWHCARRWRHWVYMAMALGMASVAYVVVMSEGYTSLVLPLLLDAIVAAHVAGTDLFHRFRSPA